ncbi:MAG TPA: hypothetical protein PK971_11350 [Saprospiraceae bacterium]|nr:hypothetical protein [Saprospiraceae bacterium]HND88918.1 hypothetical protein [Saprospiraceae bacterium]
MKNPLSKVVLCNLILFALAFVVWPLASLELHDFFFGINLAIGLLLWGLRKRVLAKAFLMAALIVPLMGAGTCALILATML